MNCRSNFEFDHKYIYFLITETDNAEYVLSYIFTLKYLDITFDPEKNP